MQKMTRLGVNECVFSYVKRQQQSGDAPNMWLTGFHASLMDRIKQHTCTHRWLSTSLLSCLECFRVSYSGSWDVVKEETSVVDLLRSHVAYLTKDECSFECPPALRPVKQPVIDHGSGFWWSLLEPFSLFTCSAHIISIFLISKHFFEDQKNVMIKWKKGTSGSLIWLAPN